MGQKLIVEKAAFDKVLKNLVDSKPVKREKIKTAKQKPAKIISRP